MNIETNSQLPTDHELTVLSPEQRIAEMADRLYSFMGENLGATLSASSLYRGVFEQAYDPTDPQASKDRNYLQFMLQPTHSFGRKFYEQCVEDGKALQVGTMYLDRENPEAKSKLRRVYRMHDASTYSPVRGEAPYFRNGFWIEWNKAIFDGNVAPEIETEQVSEDRMRKRKQRKLKRQSAKLANQQHVEVAPEESAPAKTPEWIDNFAEDLQEAMIQKETEGLMVQGDIPAQTIRMRTSSRITGTETNRERLRAAGLISKEEAKLDSSLTISKLLLADLFNSYQNQLGQKKSKPQQLAVAMVEAEVETYFADGASK